MMDPKDYSQYFISLSKMLHVDDLEQSRNPEHMKRDLARGLAQGLEPYMREACARHLRVSSEPGRLRDTTETRAEIVIMPAEDLRTLLGFVSVLRKEVQACRDDQAVRFLETST